MDTKQVIEKLRERVSKDPVAKDVCYVWAMRQRARSQVTTDGLLQRMKEGHFDHAISDYNAFLKFLGSLGVGKVENTGKGKVKLSNVKITLQSLGAAATGSDVGLNGLKQRVKYQKVTKGRRNVDIVEKIWAAPETESVLSLAYDIGDGNLIYIPVTKEMSTEALAKLVSKLQQRLAT